MQDAELLLRQEVGPNEEEMRAQQVGYAVLITLSALFFVGLLVRLLV